MIAIDNDFSSLFRLLSVYSVPVNQSNRDQLQSTIQEKTAGKLPEKSSQRKSFSKGDARYWLLPGRLFKDHQSPDYSCRFSLRGRRVQLCLNTSNLKEAARRASDAFTSVATKGWEPTLDDYRPKPQESPKKVATVGELITSATALSSARKGSINTYAKSFRKIVAEIHSIGDKKKYDPYKGGANAWRIKVDAISLTDVPPSAVLAWKNRRLKDAEVDPLTKRRATITVNSLLRNSKALFAKRVLPFLSQSILLPEELPFEGVLLEKNPSLRYVSRIDPYAILALANEELKETKPEEFKVLVLALVCGLRRGEIDNLLWRSFDFNKRILRIEHSEFHALKSEDSAGQIDLDDGTCSLFQSYRQADATSLFVIKSAKKGSKQSKAKTPIYRCNAVFSSLIIWLRHNGVDGQKPIHTLRKEIGSVIASEQGIFAASRYLRHADINITSAFYADKKKAVTPQVFAGLLSDPQKSVSKAREAEQIEAVIQ